MSLATKIFGTHSERELKRIQPVVDKILGYADEWSKLSDEELKHKTVEFKERLSNGETLDDILPEAYATVREAAKRSIGLYHYPVQLQGGILLHQGRVAELKTGEGKAVPLDTKVPTPDGWRKAGDIKVGDTLFDRCGKPTTVIGVYPQGEKEVYKVVLEDGRSVNCAEDHLWTVKVGENEDTITTGDMIRAGVKYGDNFRFSLPVSKCVEYAEKKLPMDPFNMGEAVSSGLIKYFVSNNIPEIYRTSSEKQRWELLRGLNSNSKDECMCSIKFSIDTEVLKDNLLEIAYSLGCRATYTENDGVYTVKIEVPENMREYIFGKKDDDICKCNGNCQSDKDYIKIVDIIKTGESTEQVCFEVDNNEHLFLVGDYVVTHNTLVSTCPAYLNALTGNGVHIVTVNDYLAKRDAEEMGQVHRFLGLSTGVILHDMTPQQRKAEYACDITYVTNNELGFDYLKDNMAMTKEMQVLRGLKYCIIDEVDSILIDEARTPLIISGAGSKSTQMYTICDKIVKSLERGEAKDELTRLDIIFGEGFDETGDYIVNKKDKNVFLTDEGVLKVEKMLGIDNLSDGDNLEIQHCINSALRANYLMTRDKDYIVKDGEILIVDEFTGRVMPGRRFSDGLHQAIEAKEGVEVKKESTTLATITFQNFFNKFDKKAGMTGTGLTEEKEFRATYSLDVVAVPTNKPVQRIDHDDAVYKTKREKYKAVVEAVKESHEKKQPVLVGTIDIDTSEYLSKLLHKEGIPHNVLNAKYHEQEALIVADAGHAGAVTIATNMAGRGTDIKLDEEAKNAGGLRIIGTERHESRRIDDQLRGRSGRQGDPGESKFYISLEDNLMKLFGSEKLMGVFNALGVPDGEEIKHKMLSDAIRNAQSRIELNNFGIRQNLLKFDEVNNEQREIIYAEREKILSGGSLTDIILRYADEIIDEAIAKREASVEDFADREEAHENDIWAEELVSYIPLKHKITKDVTAEELKEEAKNIYKSKMAAIEDEEQFHNIERTLFLKIIDHNWMQHISDMDILKEGVGLQAYGQRDPALEYKMQGFAMFEDMTDRIKRAIVKNMFAIRIERKPSEAEMEAEIAKKRAAIQIVMSRRAERFKEQLLRERGQKKERRIYPNDKCPCGSGEKYKDCCGKKEQEDKAV